MYKFINGFLGFGILLGSCTFGALAAEVDNKPTLPAEIIKDDPVSGRLHPPLKQNQDIKGINGETTRMDTNGDGVISPEEVRKYEEQEQKDSELKK